MILCGGCLGVSCPSPGKTINICWNRWRRRICFFFFSSRRRHTRLQGDWSSDVCSSDLLDRTWTNMTGQHPGELNADLQLCKRWFDPIAQGHRLRRELAQVPSTTDSEIGRASCRERV